EGEPVLVRRVPTGVGTKAQAGVRDLDGARHDRRRCRGHVRQRRAGAGCRAPWCSSTMSP
ncbi:MAG: hypothetical protein ACLUQ6_04980, partial [Alistipes onderdonkii]